MSRYGYLEVFQSPLEFEITIVDCIMNFLPTKNENLQIKNKIGYFSYFCSKHRICSKAVFLSWLYFVIVRL